MANGQERNRCHEGKRWFNCSDDRNEKRGHISIHFINSHTSKRGILKVKGRVEVIQYGTCFSFHACRIRQ